MNHANITPCCAELQQNSTLGMYTRKPVITICTNVAKLVCAGVLYRSQYTVKCQIVEKIVF